MNERSHESAAAAVRGRIYAHHAHVCPAEINPDGTFDRLSRLLDACGIDGATCFAPFPHQCDALGVDPNIWLAAELKHQPRFTGFGTIDFRRNDIARQVKRAAELGFRGLKLHPNAQKFAILSDRALLAYAMAEQLGMFITFHSGVHHSPLRDCRVLDFDEVAWRFPSLRFSLEHVGGYHFFREAMAVLFNHVPPPWEPHKHGRLYAGLSSVFCPGPKGFWHLERSQLLDVVAQLGARLVIFGLDFPYNLEDETRRGLETIRSLGLPEADVELILGGNLRRELRL